MITKISICAEMTTELTEDKKKDLLLEINKHLENVLIEIFDQVGAEPLDANFCVEVDFSDQEES